MVFGKIEYLNLLPFHIFMKRYLQHSSAKMAMEYKKNVPAKINDAFVSRRVDAAFISSIVAKKYHHLSLGIVARGEVKSVLIIPDKEDKKDVESASSNLLASLLGLRGEVLIGDKALRYALKHDDYIDLALKWQKRYNLPFVFALLCFHKDKKLYRTIEKLFLRHPIKIPQYMLSRAAKRVGMSQKDILSYLTLISYNLDTKALKGLHQFYALAQKSKISSKS